MGAVLERVQPIAADEPGGGQGEGNLLAHPDGRVDDVRGAHRPPGGQREAPIRIEVREGTLPVGASGEAGDTEWRSELRLHQRRTIGTARPGVNESMARWVAYDLQRHTLSTLERPQARSTSTSPRGGLEFQPCRMHLRRVACQPVLIHRKAEPYRVKTPTDGSTNVASSPFGPSETERRPR